MNKIVGIVIAIIVLAVIGLFAFQAFNNGDNNGSSSPTPTDLEINTFAECQDAGYPIQESYPAKCTTPDGQTFTEEIGDAIEKEGEIIVNNPRPNQTITSPLEITGEAIGPWYFEGSFTAELYAEGEGLIGTAILQAEGEWMTEELVPFSGEVEFTSPATGSGEIIISAANPSGLPENEKTLTIPVSFE